MALLCANTSFHLQRPFKKKTTVSVGLVVQPSALQVIGLNSCVFFIDILKGYQYFCLPRVVRVPAYENDVLVVPTSTGRRVAKKKRVALFFVPRSATIFPLLRCSCSRADLTIKKRETPTSRPPQLGLFGRGLFHWDREVDAAKEACEKRTPDARSRAPRAERCHDCLLEFAKCALARPRFWASSLTWVTHSSHGCYCPAIWNGVGVYRCFVSDVGWPGGLDGNLTRLLAPARRGQGTRGTRPFEACRTPGQYPQMDLPCMR